MHAIILHCNPTFPSHMKIKKIPCNNELCVPASIRNSVISANIKRPCINTDHTLAIVGRCSSGRSVVVQSFLKKKNQYRKAFDNVFVIAPENSLGAFKHCVFKNHDEDKMYHELTCEVLDDIAAKVEASNSEADGDAPDDQRHSLVVIDDMQSYLKQPDIEKCLLHHMSSYRHRQASYWLVVQSWFSIPRRIRNVTRAIIQFNMGSKRELEAFNEEVLPMYDRDEMRHLAKYAWKDKKDKHSFLYIDREKGTLCKNMDLLQISDDDEEKE